MFEGTLAYPGEGAVPNAAPCPWCGSKGFVHNRPGPNHRAPWAVVCAGCEARGPTATTPGEAVERWDAGPTRPS